MHPTVRNAVLLGTLKNFIPNSRMQFAEATDDVELLTNWNFATDLSGWTITQSGGSSVVWASAQHATMTYDNSAAVRMDQSFPTIVGHTYTVRVAMNSITTMSVACDIGTTQGGFTYINGLSVAAGAVYFTFVATTTTTWVRLRGRTAAGSASFYTVSAMIGGWPPDWKIGGASTARDLEVYCKVRAVGTDPSSGLPYMRVQYAGTSGAGGTAMLSFRFNAQNAIPTTNGAISTGTLLSRLVAGGMTGIASTLLSIFPSTGSSNLTPAVSPQKQLSNGAAFARDQTSGPLNNASTAAMFLSVEFTASAASSVDITYDFMMPKLNQGPRAGPDQLTP